MSKNAETAVLLRAEGAKARRMAGAVFDPLTQRLLTEYAEECEEAADKAEREAEFTRPYNTPPGD